MVPYRHHCTLDIYLEYIFPKKAGNTHKADAILIIPCILLLVLPN